MSNNMSRGYLCLWHNIIDRSVIVSLRRNYKYIVIVYIFAMLLYYFYYGNTLAVQLKETCTLEDGTKFVTQLCHNYTHGFVSGSFCDSLCVKNELRFTKCMSHKASNVILLAEWKNTNIVLKADTIETSTRNKAIPTTYSDLMKSFVLFNNLTIQVARHILSECDKGSDGVFTKTESMYCWHLHDRDEILFMFLLSGNTGITDLYGICGNMIAVEYATPKPLVQLPIAKEYRTWKLRARMSIALIEMIEALEDTKFGTLYLCDFQRSNFGFVEVNGQLIAKSIDNDISLFRDDLIMNVMHDNNKTCSSDYDCGFISCKIPCNTGTGKCSGKLTSNNLQLLCSLFLISETRYFYTGLLWEPPTSIKKDLTALLSQCAYPLTPSERISKNVAKQLKKLLQSSLNE